MNIFKALFPIIYDAVSGKSPDVISGVSNILGIKDKNIDVSDLPNTLKDLSSEQIIQLKKLENDSDELALENTISARNMNTVNREKFLPILGIVTIVSTFVMVAYLFRFEVPESNKAIIYTLAGNILAWPTLILNFYYGSSVGSREKNKLIFGPQKESIDKK